LTADSVGDWREVVAQVDALFLSEDELEVGSRDEPRAALKSLASGRLRLVLFKRGARGGLLLQGRARGLERLHRGAVLRAYVFEDDPVAAHFGQDVLHGRRSACFRLRHLEGSSLLHRM